MNCQQVQDQLLSFVCGACDQADRGAIEAHLNQGCPACAAALADAGAAVTALALSLPPTAPPPHVKIRLLRRARAELGTFGEVRGPASGADEMPDDLGPRSRATTAPASSAVSPALVAPPAVVPPAVAPRPAAGPRRWARAAVAASLLAALAAAAFSLALARRSARREADLRSEVEFLRTEFGQLHAEQLRLARSLRLFQSPAVRMVSLDGKEQPDSRGRIFWDRPHGVWHFHAAGLRSAGRGRVYELWVIDDRATKIPAGTFEVDALGEGTLDVSLPPAAGRVSVAAVTDEPLGGRPQPTGKIQMAGSVGE